MAENSGKLSFKVARSKDGTIYLTLYKSFDDFIKTCKGKLSIPAETSVQLIAVENGVEMIVDQDSIEMVENKALIIVKIIDQSIGIHSNTSKVSTITDHKDEHVNSEVSLKDTTENDSDDTRKTCSDEMMNTVQVKEAQEQMSTTQYERVTGSDMDKTDSFHTEAGSDELVNTKSTASVAQEQMGTTQYERVTGSDMDKTDSFHTEAGSDELVNTKSTVLLGHRIEPLTSDMFTTETQMFYSQELDESDNTFTAVPVTKETNAVSTEIPRGEIKKGFYCPTCGNKFSNQIDLVHHLREHIHAENYKSRRRGRPRKNEITNERNQCSVNRNSSW